MMTFWKLLKNTSPICFCHPLFAAWEVSNILQVFPSFQKEKLSMLAKHQLRLLRLSMLHSICSEYHIPPSFLLFSFFLTVTFSVCIRGKFVLVLRTYMFCKILMYIPALSCTLEASSLYNLTVVFHAKYV
jgi:hypothetical protein